MLKNQRNTFEGDIFPVSLFYISRFFLSPDFRCFRYFSNLVHHISFPWSVSKRERERDSEFIESKVWVWVWVRETERKCVRMCVVWKREISCVCVCQRKKEREREMLSVFESECVCVCVWRCWVKRIKGLYAGVGKYWHMLKNKMDNLAKTKVEYKTKTLLLFNTPKQFFPLLFHTVL